MPTQKHPEISSFIVFDGPSGTGKGTLISLVEERLTSLGLDTLVFAEETADENRAEILEARDRGKATGGTGDREMVGVLVRHRQQLYETIVAPAILSGRTVLADRGEPATLAYQTVKKELAMEEVWKMHRQQTIRLPDAVILTLCSPETALLREEQDLAVNQQRRLMESGKGLSGKVSSDPGADREVKLRSRRAIHFQYAVVTQFLEEKDVSVLTIDTEKNSPTQELALTMAFFGFTE